jgi:hypothetical protein
LQFTGPAGSLRSRTAATRNATPSVGPPIVPLASAPSSDVAQKSHDEILSHDRLPFLESRGPTLHLLFQVKAGGKCGARARYDYDSHPLVHLGQVHCKLKLLQHAALSAFVPAGRERIDADRIVSVSRANLFERGESVLGVVGAWAARHLTVSWGCWRASANALFASAPFPILTGPLLPPQTHRINV